MKLTQELEYKLKSLSKSDTKDFLIEYFELVKAEVADVRNPINAPAEHQNAIRIGICDVIDEMLIQKLKVLSEDREDAKDNWK